MKQISIYVAAAILVLSTACQSAENKAAELNDVRGKIYANGGFNKDEAEKYLSLTDAFLKNYPSDTSCPTTIYRAGQVAMTLGNGDKAVEYFSKYRAEFKAGPKAEEALFNLAFSYSELKKDTENARKYFDEFLKTYPNSELADDAAAMFMFSGKTDEQIISELEAKNAAADTSLKSVK
jgi:outer membrane protein assembly factor BamD (BamD/ComL family)